MGQVDARDDQQSRGEECKHDSLHREMVVMVQKYIQESVAEFYQWIAQRNGRFAPGTLSSEQQITQQRNVMPWAECFLAGWAM